MGLEPFGAIPLSGTITISCTTVRFLAILLMVCNLLLGGATGSKASTRLDVCPDVRL